MGGSYPERKLKELRFKRWRNLILFTTIGFFFLFFALRGSTYFEFLKMKQWMLILLMISIFFFLLALMSLKPNKKEKMLKSGVIGERRFRKYLEKISGYKFYNLPVPGGGDIDALLICSRGVFAFEVKNYSGIIECRDNMWRRIKFGKNGSYKAYVGNPSEEAMIHAIKLQNYLIRQGITVSVFPIVVITHPEAILKDINSCEVPVIKSEKIKSVLKGEKLSRKDQTKIMKIIKKLKNS